jgi:hypothetical protein
VPDVELTGTPRVAEALLGAPDGTVVKGQTVVVMATTEVTTAVPSEGQLVASAAHLVTVKTVVVKKVVVVTASWAILRSCSPRRIPGYIVSQCSWLKEATWRTMQEAGR